MMKNVSKIIAMVLVIMLAVSLITPVFAVDPTMIGDKINTTGTAQDKVQDVSGQIIGIVQIVGTAIAIIMLVVLGIKYVVAAPSEKAEIKKSAVIYVVAAIFLFGAVQILGVIKNFTDDTLQ